MGTLDPKVEMILAKRDIIGLIRLLQDESESRNKVWDSAYAALMVISSEIPLSSSDINDIAKAIAEHGNYLLDEKYHVPHENRKHSKGHEDYIGEVTQKLLNIDTFRTGRLPEKLWDEVLDFFWES